MRYDPIKGYPLSFFKRGLLQQKQTNKQIHVMLQITSYETMRKKLISYYQYVPLVMLSKIILNISNIRNSHLRLCSSDSDLQCLDRTSIKFSPPSFYHQIWRVSGVVPWVKLEGCKVCPWGEITYNYPGKVKNAPLLGICTVPIFHIFYPFSG